MRETERRFFETAKQSPAEIPPLPPPRPREAVAAQTADVQPEPTPAASSPPPQETKRGSRWRIVVAGVVVLGVLGLAGVLGLPALRKWRSEANQASPTEAEVRETAKREAEEALKRKYRNAPESVRATLNALKKFEARTEVGLNISQYREALGDTWGQVKVFSESPDGKQYDEATKLFLSAITSYQTATTAWDNSIYDERIERIKDLEVRARIVAAELDALFAEEAVSGRSDIGGSRGRLYQVVGGGITDFADILSGVAKKEYKGEVIDTHTALAWYKKIGDALRDFCWRAARCHISRADALLNP